MFCSKCGNQFSQNDGNFCPKCGHSKNAPAPTIPTAVTIVAPNKAPGRTFLLVTGILYIIFGAIAMLWGGVINEAGRAFGSFGSSLAAYGVFVVIASIANIILGIVGIALKDKTEKPKMMGLMVGAGALLLIEIITSAAFGGAFIPTMFIISLVLPALFIVGAAKNHSVG